MKLREKLNALKAAKAEYHAKANTLTSPQIQEERLKFEAMQKDISDTITEGAKDCEGGHRPLGIFHDGTPNPFEIGDPAVRDRRVREALPEDAVESWNAGRYMAPREEGTLLMTHKAVTGEIKSQKTVKAQPA
jgi:hypothetical protein